MEDWAPALNELRRVLKPGGRLLLSVDHPFTTFVMHRQAGRDVSYFETYNWTEDWTMTGHSNPMSFWNRPVHAMTNAFAAAAFSIANVSEPQPVPTAEAIFPDDYRVLTRSPCFLLFGLEAS